MCTSAATVTQLAAAVGASAVDLAQPSEDLRPSLMLRLVAPEFVGSEHVKWMLQNPDAYTVRRPLVEQLIRSFYGVLWNEFHPFRRRVKLEVFTGAHAERAIARLHTGRWCTAEQGVAPALPTRSRLGSLFVHTPDAVTARRADLVTFFATRASPPVDAFESAPRRAPPATLSSHSFDHLHPTNPHFHAHTPVIARPCAALCCPPTLYSHPSLSYLAVRSRVAALGDGQAQLTEKAMTGMLRSYSMLIK